MRNKKQETRNKKPFLVDFSLFKKKAIMGFFTIFLLGACQVENKDEFALKSSIQTENRTEFATDCGEHDIEGCRMVTQSRSFFYEGCEYFVIFKAFICPDRIILDPIAFAIASMSNDCLEILRKRTDYWMTPYVGVELSYNYERLIRNNLTDQVRDHILNNVVNSSERENFRCTQQNPCEDPTTFSFTGLRKDCYTFCVDSWVPDPDDINESLVNLKRVLCGIGGCCEKNTPFCYDSNGAPCFGTPSTELITECHQNFTFDECIYSGQYCPTVCNN